MQLIPIAKGPEPFKSERFLSRVANTAIDLMAVPIISMMTPWRSGGGGRGGGGGGVNGG